MLYICPCKITTLTNRRTRGHYKSQGYGQLNMKANDVNKVQKAVKKSETETLTGAVKAWCRLFSSSKDVMGIIKENNIEVPKDIIPALVALAKDKELVITICKEILANIDGVFCQYIEIEKIYNDENESVNNKVMLAEKQAQKIILGTTHKAFGYCASIKYSDDKSGYFVIYNNERYKSTRMATKITNFSFSLIAKCITYYLTHDKNVR